MGRINLELYDQHGASTAALNDTIMGILGNCCCHPLVSGATAKTSATSIVMTLPDRQVLWRAPLARAAETDVSKWTNTRQRKLVNKGVFWSLVAFSLNH
jgi:hypothetical protein